MSKLPARDDILQWIEQNPTKTSKRDIARAFGIKGAARIDLKRILRELEADGLLQKEGKRFRDPDALPPVSVLTVNAPDRDGDLTACPMEWNGEGDAPLIQLVIKSPDPALGAGDRILGRLTKTDEGYDARLIRKIGSNTKPRILGIYRTGSEGGRVVPIDKGQDREWMVLARDALDARDGQLVEAEQSGPKGRMGLPRARIVTVLGDPSAGKSVSLIAIHQHGIPDHFPDDVGAEADAQKPAGLKGREDLRDLPLVTIDPWDARDHDDACYAHADDDPKNPDGHVIWVSIADVAHHVTPGSELDREARKRGNSTYFPDRVVPMLPDVLSGDLCSLHEGVERACLAVRMQVDADGAKIAHTFHRGLMKSPAALNYEEVQAGMDGDPNDRVAAMMSDVIRPLYAAYAALKRARADRQPLELDLPERQIELDDDGTVTAVNFKDRLDAHKLIEEFMVLANVAAAETLSAKQTPLLFRVHEEPGPEKLDALRETAVASGLTLAKGQVLKTAHLNQLLKAAAGTENAELINISTLRSMTQAYYNRENFGHFGLALRSYAHFTSPIRRYADLIVHRALISAHGWGDDGLTPQDIETLDDTAQHISDTERRSMTAERDTTDRYLASFLSDRLGADFTGRVSGIARFGIFVKLDGNGADGLIPMRNIGREYFHHDAETQTLRGADTGVVIGLGQRAKVRLSEAVPVTGGLMLELLELEDRKIPQGSGHRGKGRGKPSGGGPRRKASTAKKKAAKTARKVKRTRR
ncbi:MAG: ribonuclease R [Paracoccaceae bacterium]|nr:ribonuclease R [Paracoccaceae bacterium]